MVTTSGAQPRETLAPIVGATEQITLAAPVWYFLGVNDSFVTKQDLAEAVAPLASKQDVAELRRELKEDVAELRREVKEDIAELRREFKQDLAEYTDKLTETIRDAQTEMLRAFHNWARPVELRLNRTDDLSTRLGWIEERLAALERGKFPSAN